MGKHFSLIAALWTLTALAGSTTGNAGAIHAAARDGLLSRVEQLIGEDPKLVHARDEHQFTPLHWAAANGHMDVMKYLLNHGAEPDARSEAVRKLLREAGAGEE